MLITLIIANNHLSMFNKALSSMITVNVQRERRLSCLGMKRLIFNITVSILALSQSDNIRTEVVGMKFFSSYINTDVYGSDQDE